MRETKSNLGDFDLEDGSLMESDMGWRRVEESRGVRAFGRFYVTDGKGLVQAQTFYQFG